MPKSEREIGGNIRAVIRDIQMLLDRDSPDKEEKLNEAIRLLNNSYEFLMDSIE